MRKPLYQFIPNGTMYLAVELVDDVELIHGHIVGEPRKNGKIIDPKTKEIFRIHEVIEQPQRVVMLERV